MGKLLLAHLQKAQPAPCTDASEDLPIKNTFIHFEGDRQAGLPRHRTAPSTKNPFIHFEGDRQAGPQVSKGASTLTTNSGASTPSSDMKDNDSLALAAVVNMLVGSKIGLDAKDMPSQAVVADEKTLPIACWNVDGRRFNARDTRITSNMQPLVGAGPACADIVVTIFPLPVSVKRGGACFKAANGIGRIQLKCNNPIDVELSVCITVGTYAARFQRHNFVTNPLMTFDGDWNFSDLVKASVADRPTVAVSLQLFPAEDADWNTPASTRIAPDIIDPAIVAFSLSTTACPVREAERPFTWGEPWGAETTKVHFGDFDDEETATGQNSTEVTPRTPPESMQAAWSPAMAPPPPSSPFFSFEGSFLFSFTLRRADMVTLGLDVNRDEFNQELVVERVIPGGAAEAWNRQCFAGPFSSKAVVPDDRIVGINGHSNCAGMLEECRQNQLLKLFVVRGDLLHGKIPLGWCGAAAPPPTIQYVAVPVLFPMPCVKHEIVECNGGFTATSPEQFGADAVPFCCEVLASGGALWAAAPEFFPAPGTEQDGDAGTCMTDDDL